MLRQKGEVLNGDYAQSRIQSLVKALNRERSLGNRVAVKLMDMKSGLACSYEIVDHPYVTPHDSYEYFVARFPLTGHVMWEIPLDEDLQVVATREAHSIASPSQPRSLYVPIGDHEL